MNRINAHIKTYSMNVNRLLNILWSNPLGFDEFEFMELSELVNKSVNRIDEWKDIRDAIRRPSR